MSAGSWLMDLYIGARNRLARLALFVDRWTGGRPDSEIDDRGSVGLYFSLGLILCLPGTVLFLLLPQSYQFISLFVIVPAFLMCLDVVATADRLRRQGKETGRLPWREPNVTKPPSRTTLEDYIDNESPRAGGDDKRSDDGR